MNRCTSPNWEEKLEKVGEETSPSARSGTMILSIKSEPFNLESKHSL
jgi:hypothetical protein